MKVKELIALLSSVDPDLDIQFLDDDECYLEIDTIYHYHSSKKHLFANDILLDESESDYDEQSNCLFIEMS